LLGRGGVVEEVGDDGVENEEAWGGLLFLLLLEAG